MKTIKIPYYKHTTSGCVITEEKFQVDAVVFEKYKIFIGYGWKLSVIEQPFDKTIRVEPYHYELLDYPRWSLRFCFNETDRASQIVSAIETVLKRFDPIDFQKALMKKRTTISESLCMEVKVVGMRPNDSYGHFIYKHSFKLEEMENAMKLCRRFRKWKNIETKESKTSAECEYISDMEQEYNDFSHPVGDPVLIKTTKMVYDEPKKTITTIVEDVIEVS